MEELIKTCSFKLAGESYELELIQESDSIDIKVTWREYPAGSMKCTFLSHQTLWINDLFVPDHITMQFKWLFFLKRRRAMRAKGIGTYMLNFLEGHARSLGIKVISGEVVDRDLAKTPKLLEWYEKRGYPAMLDRKGDLGGCVIEKRL